MNGARSAALMAVLVFSLCAGSAMAQRVLSADEAKTVSIKDLKAAISEVGGVIVNNTAYTVRDIEILVQYHWLWTDEFKPGLESPGRVASFKLDKELLPGESTPFRYVPSPPLPARQDGRFDPEVMIAGFTIVRPATTTSK